MGQLLVFGDIVSVVLIVILIVTDHPGSANVTYIHRVLITFIVALVCELSFHIVELRLGTLRLVNQGFVGSVECYLSFVSLSLEGLDNVY